MILSWDICEIRSETKALHGVKLRGTIRKFTIEHGITCLVENTTDEENLVRFALIAESDPAGVIDFVKDVVPEAIITESLRSVHNPVLSNLSKLKVNDICRYE